MSSKSKKQKPSSGEKPAANDEQLVKAGAILRPRPDFPVDAAGIPKPKPGWNGSSLGWSQPPINLEGGMIKVPSLCDAKPVELEAFEMEVNVSPLLATCTFHLTFYNPHDKVLEGELEFPLPDGATISGFGLDVDGAIVDASIVEKEKARQVFEKEVNRKVDPALVEVTKGNSFTTRVYPLPPKGRRVIKVVYVTELEVSSTGQRYFWHPYPADAATDFTLRATVVTTDPHAAPAFFTEDLSGVQFESDEEVGAGVAVWRVNLEEKKFKAAAPYIVIALPLQEKPVAHAMTEKSRFSEEEQFFVITDQIPAIKNKSASDAKVGKIAVLWDASLSRHRVDKTQEVELLKKIAIAKLADDGEVELYVFSNVVRPRKSFAKDKVDELGKYLLEEVAYDGATRIDTFKLHSSKTSGVAAFVLLFTDGMSTMGQDVGPFLSHKKTPPIYAFTGSSQVINRPLLQYWTTSTGGNLFKLNNTEDATILSQIGRPALSFVGLTATEGEVVDVVPSSVTPMALGADGSSTFVVVGKLKSKNARVTLSYGFGKNKEVHTSLHKLAKSSVDTGLIGLLWAQKKLNELMMLQEKNKNAIKDLGTQFSLVTPGTSLLVLESLEQHLKYKIKPAATRSFFKQYEQQVQRTTENNQAKIKQKLDNVWSMWKERVAWWEKSKNGGFAAPGTIAASSDSDGDDEEESEIQLNSRQAERESRLESEERSAPRVNKNKSPKKKSSAPRAASAMAPRPSAKRREVAASDSSEEEEGDMDDSGDELESKKSDKAEDAPTNSVAAKVTIKEWTPDTPYLRKMNEAKDLDAAYKVYLEERKAFETSPSFFFDCSSFFFLKDQEGLEYGLRVLSNILELKLDEPQLLRMVGYKFTKYGQHALAEEVFEKVLSLRPEEPHSFRDYGLILELNGDYQKSAEMLWKCITGCWGATGGSLSFAEVPLTGSTNCGGIEVVALTELGGVFARAEREGKKIELPKESERFIKNLDMDLRITMAWDTNHTDLDIHVKEPSREECYFGNKTTSIGGYCPYDFRDGYGPEEYMLYKAHPGTFDVFTNYFSSHQQTLQGPTSTILSLFTNWGRPNQEVSVVVTRLVERGNNIAIGNIKIAADGVTAPKMEEKKPKSPRAAGAAADNDDDAISPRKKSDSKCSTM